jgi:two-component system osmolarity sensor histidine kinase EnvZ
VETEEDVAALGEDLAEMERMVAAYLSFARGEGTEQPAPADLSDLVHDVAAKARRAGAEVAVETPGALVLPMRAEALRRCLGNLLDNARRHAQRIAVAVDTVPRTGLEAAAGAQAPLWAQVIVDDNGPGIAEADREEAFRPFSSGTPDGTGLGLAMARDIVRAHGGDIVLEASPLGGLRARLTLPV